MSDCARGPLIPIPPGEQGTKEAAWSAPDYTPGAVPDGWNVGQRMDGVTGIDCDGQAAVDWWRDRGQSTPYVSESQPGHRVYWFKGEVPGGTYDWVLPDGTRAGEVRTGRTHYCVIPPSVHPNGTTYYWMGPELFEPDGAPLPEIDLTKLPPRYGRQGRREQEDILTSVWGDRLPSENCPGSGHAHGDQNPSLGMQERDGLVYARCFAGCDFYEVLELLVSSGRYQRDELWFPAGRDLDTPWEADITRENATGIGCAFPTEALPDELRALVHEGARSICCPADYIGAAGLAVLGAAIGGNVALAVTDDWHERAGLWIAIVGDPGTRKSPALRPLVAPVFAEQGRLFERAKIRRAQERIDAKAEKRPVDRTPVGRVVVDDTTMEALHQVLEDNAAGVLMHSDELAGWVKGMGAYKNGLGRDRQHWLSIWAGKTFTVDRKGSDFPMFVKDPFVPIVGGIQPDSLSDVSQSREDGLLERLLLAQGEQVPVRLTRDRISPETQQAYENLWWRLREQSFRRETVTMSNGAWETFLKWHDATMGEMDSAPPLLRGIWAKMPAQCGRIALILNRCLPEPGPMEAETIERAIKLSDYFKGQVRRVTMGQENNTPYEKAYAARLDQLEEWFANNPEATNRDVMRRGPKWARKADVLKLALSDLEAAGRVVARRPST